MRSLNGMTDCVWVISALIRHRLGSADRQYVLGLKNAQLKSTTTRDRHVGINPLIHCGA
jgi:hypothetical protein